jgi:hypothetical protein
MRRSMTAGALKRAETFARVGWTLFIVVCSLRKGPLCCGAVKTLRKHYACKKVTTCLTAPGR